MGGDVGRGVDAGAYIYIHMSLRSLGYILFEMNNELRAGEKLRKPQNRNLLAVQLSACWGYEGLSVSKIRLGSVSGQL